MKAIFTFFVLFSIQFSFAQTSEEEVITSFFDAFHKQDTVAMKVLTHNHILMRRIAHDEVDFVVEEQDFALFLNSIHSIPTEVSFEEKLLDIRVETDGILASVWTPYEFFVNGKMSHCGTNVFQLMNSEEGWKIISLIDTYNKDCGDEK